MNRKTRFQKALSVLLTVALVLCSVPFAYAQADELPAAADVQEGNVDLPAAEDVPQEDDTPEADLPVWSGGIADSFAGGDGTEAHPYQIANGEQLALFGDKVKNAERDGVEEFYAVLMNSIKLNETADWALWGTDGYDASRLHEWEPIEAAKGIARNKDDSITNGSVTYESTAAVHFDGNGKTIYGLYINRPDEDFIGLFSADYAGGSYFANLRIKHSFLCGRDCVGAVVGFSDFGDVLNCSVEDAVISGGNYVGGIVGYLYYSTINNSSANASVSGGSYIGGIAGCASGETINCTNRGRVTGDGSHVGGIVGHGFGLIRMCCNQETGTVTGQTYVGGVAGDTVSVSCCYNLGSVTGIGTANGIGGITGSGMAHSCYNAGPVKGKRNTDPICRSFPGDLFFNSMFSLIKLLILNTLLGDEFDDHSLNSFSMPFSTATDCYYLDDAGLYNDSVRASNAAALTAAQMSKDYCYTNWDFEHIWTIPEDGAFPQFLKDVVRLDQKDYKSRCDAVRVWNGEVADGFAGGSGTADDPYVIEKAAELAYLAQTVNAGESYAGQFFRLESDIVLNNAKNTGTKHWSAYASEWTSIGNDNGYNCCFSGIFDGQGKKDGMIHSVSGLILTQSFSETHTGLFGYIQNGAVKNLRITDSYVFGTNIAGGICGLAENVSFENCSFDGTVCGTTVGGIVGICREGSSITQCRNAGTVFCYTGKNAGGIAGDCIDSRIGLSYNTGRIFGMLETGGIVGSAFRVNIQQCFNSGYVCGLAFVSGIAAVISGDFGEHAVIQNCYNSGYIDISMYGGGGIAAIAGAADLIDCYNCGLVGAGSWTPGGVSGMSLYLKIMRSLCTGCIVGPTMACTVRNDFFLKNDVCKRGLGLIRWFNRVRNMKALTADELQDSDKLRKALQAGDVWRYADSFTGDTDADDAQSLAYLYPQLTGLPHRPGNEYKFSYVAGSGRKSASPYVFSNGSSCFSDFLRMDGIYEALFYDLLDASPQSGVLAKAKVALWKIASRLRGHCFGMSAVMALYMTGELKMKDFQWQASAPFDFLNPVDSNTVESLINYFQLGQHLLPEDSKFQSPDEERKVHADVIRAMIDALETNECVLLGGESPWMSHFVVAYNNGGWKRDSSGRLSEAGGTVGIWDPEHSQSVTGMTITQTADGSYDIVCKQKDFYLTQIITVDDLGALCQKLRENVSSLNLSSFPSGKVKPAANTSAAVSAQSAGSGAEIDTVLVTSLDRFEVADQNSRTAVVINGAVQAGATLAIRGGSIINEEDALPLRQFTLPKDSAGFTVTPTDSGASRSDVTLLSSESANWYSVAETDRPMTIRFNLSERSVETDPLEADAGTEIGQTVVSGYDDAATPWNSVEVRGTTEGISQTIDEANCSFTTASDAEMTVTVSDGVNTAESLPQVVRSGDPMLVKHGGDRTVSVTREADAVRAQQSDGKAENTEEAKLGWTVFFVSGTDDGNISAPVKPGDKAPQPPAIRNPEQCVDCIFRGWYTEDGTPWDFENNTVNQNIQLIAKWEEIKIEPRSKATLIGRKMQMNVSGMNDYDSITWNSLNEAAVSIDKDGTVKLKKRGSSAIVATLTRGGIVYQAQYDLKVYGPVEYVFVSLVNYVKRIFPKP